MNYLAIETAVSVAPPAPDAKAVSPKAVASEVAKAKPLPQTPFCRAVRVTVPATAMEATTCLLRVVFALIQAAKAIASAVALAPIVQLVVPLPEVAAVMTVLRMVVVSLFVTLAWVIAIDALAATGSALED
jgi:hypothetical protein